MGVNRGKTDFGIFGSRKQKNFDSLIDAPMTNQIENVNGIVSVIIFFEHFL